MVNELLNENEHAECLIMSELGHKRPTPLQRDRLTYDRTVKISDNKNPALARLSVYVHANNTFRESMSHAVIEAMATGLPVVFLDEGGVIREVTGSAGIRCRNQQELKREISALLNNQELREMMGKRGIEQAKAWDLKKTVVEFDAEIKRCLKAIG